MDWFQPLDIYCERQSIGVWNEPVNALTNLAFIILGFLLAFKTKKDKFSFCLSNQIIIIGIASFSFHTFANPIAGLIDIFSILLFGMAYISFVNYKLMKLGLLISIILALLLIPFSFFIYLVTVFFFGELNGSSWYLSFIILFLIYFFLLKSKFHELSLTLLFCFIFFSFSLVLRSLDNHLCDLIQVGTHFIWHIMNAILLSLLVWFFHRSSNLDFDH